jgi:hypothetical protein
MADMCTDKELTAQFLASASANHLARVQTLQGTEWRVAFLLWTAIALSTAGILSGIKDYYNLILERTYVLVVLYYAVSFAYLFGFCKENYKSLVTERNRYQFFQNEYANLVAPEHCKWQIKAKDGGLPVNSVINSQSFAKSAVWGFKVLSTTSMMTGSFIVIVLSSISLYEKVPKKIFVPSNMFYTSIIAMISLLLFGIFMGFVKCARDSVSKLFAE